jgi:outer membrane receptor protein involved in Fe transport
MRISKLSYAVIAALTTTSVYAQEAAPKAGKVSIETIEVTATKRSESIQDIPVSVTALNGEALENLGVDNFQ